MSEVEDSGDTSAQVRQPTRARRPPPRIPAHQWRLLLPLILMTLTAAAYHWEQQRYQGVDELRVALSRQAELAARIDALAREAAAGHLEAVAKLRRTRSEAAAAANELKSRFAAATALRDDDRATSALAEIGGAWAAVQSRTDSVLKLADATATVRADVETFQSMATGILVTTDELVDALVAAEEPAAQIRAASRQLLLIQRISSNVRRVLEGGDGVITAADRFGRDAVLFGEVNIGLLNGNPRLDLQRVRAPAAREILVDIGREFRRSTELIEQIMAEAIAMVEARETAAEIGKQAASIATRVDTLERLVAAHSAERAQESRLTEIFGLLALVSLLVVMGHIAAATRRARVQAREQHAKEDARRRQRDERDARIESREQATEAAVRRVVAELERLSKSDALAEVESVNEISDTPLAPLEVAVGGVRRRLRTLTRAAVNVSQTGSGLFPAARGARAAVDEHGKRLERATAATRRMAAHVEVVGERGRKAEQHATDARVTLAKVTEALKQSTEQMQDTHRFAKTTAARVRQLDESTRQIQEVGRLVDEISEQCRMLSLNVSIRASLSDDATPSGAARFAEEVQKLADNARRAMRRIDGVNEDVRAHAGQAADSIKQVMWSAESAVTRGLEAGKDISTAASLSQRLETLNHSLVEALQEHAKLMTEVVKSTTSVNEVATHARHELREIADGAARLSELTALLDAAVSGFQNRQESDRTVIEISQKNQVSLSAPADDAGPETPKQVAGKD